MTAQWSDGVTISGEKPFRKVVATRPIKRGEIVLREYPVLTLLNPKHWGVRCNGCFSKPSDDTKLLRCSRCRRFWYCTKTCQRKDWKVHKEECSALLDHGDKLTADEESHLADAILTARAFRLKETSPQQFQLIEDLVFHEDCIIQQNHKDIAKLFLTMKLLDDSSNTAMNTTTRDILEMLARFDSNNFGIVCDLLFFLGAGIYPAGAMLNHSCDHNCAIAYEGQTNQQIIRCIVDVAEREELCHPYIDFASTSVQRREKLRKTYGFDCHCDRCVDPDGRWAQVDQWLSTESSAEANRVIAETEPLLQQAAMTDDIHAELSLIRQCVDARARVLHPRHLSLYLARSQLHTASMAAGELNMAMEQCLEIVETMRKCFYRPEHPLVGIMLYTLGSLHHSLNSFDKAINCYEEALPILESYHGVNHSFTQGCRDYLRQAQQESRC